MIRCAMFDLFNVLVFGNATLLFEFINRHRRSHTTSLDSFFSSQTICLYESGKIDNLEFFRRCKDDFGLENVSREEFYAVAFTKNIEPDWRMVKLKDTLKQNGLKLALVSNVGPAHLRYIESNWPKVFDNFDYLSLSFRCGLRKPHPRIYLDAIERLWVRPEECFFVDDQISNVIAFEQLARIGHRGVGHHYNVVDENSRPNGRLEIERNRLLLRMVNLGMLNTNQASGITRVDLA